MKKYGLGYKIRIGLIILGFFYGVGSGFIQPNLPFPHTDPGWYWIPLWFGSTVLMMVMLLGVIGFQRFNPFQTEAWEQPHMNSLPTFYDHVHFFHMFGLSVIPIGIGRFLTVGIIYFQFDAASINVVLNGSGILVATWLCPYFFPQLYEESRGDEDKSKEIAEWKYQLLHISFMAANLVYITVPLLILYGDEPLEVADDRVVLVSVTVVAVAAVVLTIMYLLRRLLFQPPEFLIGSGVPDYYSNMYLAGIFVQGILFDMVSAVGVILCILLNSIYYLIPFVIISFMLFLMHWPSTQDFRQKKRALSESR